MWVLYVAMYICHSRIAIYWIRLHLLCLACMSITTKHYANPKLPVTIKTLEHWHLETYPHSLAFLLSSALQSSSVIRTMHFVVFICIFVTSVDCTGRILEYPLLTRISYLSLNIHKYVYYTGCSLTYGTNFDSLYKNPKITLFQE